VVGRSEPGLRERVDALVQHHVPDLTPAQVRERPSANGRFVSITYLIRAQSAAQVEALVTDLRACEGVLMLL
jgi:putative lipoic acid-binding regulatory protein